MRTFSLKTEEIEQKKYVSRTYAMKEQKVEGFVDGLQAVRQAVDKILNTERYEYPVYSFSYGIEWKKLIGKEHPYVRAEFKRIVREALAADDRIREVSDFQFLFEEDTCICSFCVESVYGKIEKKLEVTV